MLTKGAMYLPGSRVSPVISWGFPSRGCHRFLGSRQQHSIAAQSTDSHKSSVGSATVIKHNWLNLTYWTMTNVKLELWKIIRNELVESCKTIKIHQNLTKIIQNHQDQIGILQNHKKYQNHTKIMQNHQNRTWILLNHKKASESNQNHTNSSESNLNPGKTTKKHENHTKIMQNQ